MRVLNCYSSKHSFLASLASPMSAYIYSEKQAFRISVSRSQSSLFSKIFLFKKFSRVVVYCSVIKVLFCFRCLERVSLFIISQPLSCVKRFFKKICFFIFSFDNRLFAFPIFRQSEMLKANGEGGIWTLAPLLTTYSLSRGAPSASLGTSPKCPVFNIHDDARIVQYFFEFFYFSSFLFLFLYFLTF